MLEKMSENALTLSKLTSLKQKLDELRPFSKDALESLERWFEIELTYSSNAIEGNTLTRQETALILEKGLTVGGKSMREHLEAINHQNALTFMKQLVSDSLTNNPSARSISNTLVTTIMIDDILSIHRLILKGIDDTNAGRIRTSQVRISGSMVILPNALKVPELLDEFMAWMREIKSQENKGEHPVVFAALAHYKLVTIHPFVDGNGRSARLLMNLILMQHGYPPAIISPKDRLKYIKGLEKAQLGGSLDDYLHVISQAVLCSLNIYLKALKLEKTQQLEQLNPENLSTLMKIGELAKASNESISTIRYWTKIGLLEVTTTTPSGYQLYSNSTTNRCKYIRKLQNARYNLDEIAVKLEDIGDDALARAIEK